MSSRQPVKRKRTMRLAFLKHIPKHIAKGSATTHPAPESDPMDPMQRVIQEVRSGPFSILSASAQDRILFLVRSAMQVAFENGCKETRCKISPKLTGKRAKNSLRPTPKGAK